MRPLLELARAHDLKLVEDCAQAHGATYGGAAAGTMGDAAAFSFYPTKNLGALGDGGAVTTNRADVDRAARRMRSYGESRQYDSVCRGRNSRLDTVQAAVLEVKLGHLDEWIDRRRAIAAAYQECAAEAGGLEGPVDGAMSRHAYHLYVVAVAERDAFRARLASAGVETLVHYPRAVHQHPAYANLTPHGGLPVSEALVRRVVSLPLYPEMSDAEVELVAAALSQAATGT
jgi:dTDP-3-amino-3,4,6-trideoxy-alpha-D-glucose transaminase